jgi:hypothetical protein
MRHSLIILASIVALTTVHAAAPTGTDARARELIQTLHLQLLPGESGYLGLIGQSAQTIPIDGHQLAVQSQVYYMLTRDRPVNYLHWLATSSLKAAQ